MQAKAEWTLLGLTAMWGATFVVIKAVLADISPQAFLAARFSVAVLVLTPLYWSRFRRSAVKGCRS